MVLPSNSLFTMRLPIFLSLAILLTATSGQDPAQAPPFCSSNPRVTKIMTVFNRVFITVDKGLWRSDAGDTYTYYMNNNSFKATTDYLHQLFRPPPGGAAEMFFDAALTPTNQPHRWCEPESLNITNWPQVLFIFHRTSSEPDGNRWPVIYNYTVTDLNGGFDLNSFGAVSAYNVELLPSVKFFEHNRVGRYHGAVVDPVTCNRYFLLAMLNQVTLELIDYRFFYTPNPNSYYDVINNLNPWQEVPLNQMLGLTFNYVQFNFIFTAQSRVFGYSIDRALLYELDRTAMTFQRSRLTVRKLICEEFIRPTTTTTTTEMVEVEPDDEIAGLPLFVFIGYSVVGLMFIIAVVLFAIWMLK